MGKRLSEIDIIRGLAAIAVIIIHTSTIPLAENCSAGFRTLLCVTFFTVSKFAVPVFVILSGAGLALSNKQNESYLSFITRRLTKILPAYVIWSVMYSLIYTKPGSAGIYFNNVSFSTIATDLITGRSCYHLYFVPRILLLYMLFPLIYKPLRTKTGLAVSAFISAAFLTIGKHLGGANQSQWISLIAGTISWTLYFGVGIWLVDARVVDMIKSKWCRRTVSLVILPYLVLLIAMVYRSVTKTNDHHLDAQLPMILLIPYSFMIIIWGWNQKWPPSLNTFFRLIAKYSYGIYLSHVFVMMVFMQIILRLPFIWNQGILSIVSFLFTLAGATALSAASGAVTKKTLGILSR